MRHTTEARFRFVGPKEKCAAYVPAARTLLGSLINRDSELGGLPSGVHRSVLPDGTRINVAFGPEGAPLIEIITTGGGGEPTSRRYYLIRLAWDPEGIVLTPSIGEKNEEDPELDTYKDWGLPSRDGAGIGEKLFDAEQGETLAPENLTELGAFPQVILNKYKNNKYVDRIEYIEELPEEVAGLKPLQEVIDAADYESPYPNPLLRLSMDTPFSTESKVRYAYGQKIAKPYSYADPTQVGEVVPVDDDEYYTGEVYWATVGDTNEPGVYRIDEELAGVEVVRRVVTLLKPQYTRDFISQIFEAPPAEPAEGEEAKWYTHRAEELLYPDNVAETIYQRTNLYRLDIDEKPVHRIVRGDANSAYLVGKQTSRPPGHFHHSHPDFQPGYRTAGARVFLATGREPYTAYGHNVRENMLILGDVPEDVETQEELGIYITDLWAASPTHYTNMVEAAWSDFPVPYASWEGGTKLAGHHIGTAGGSASYVDRQDYGAPAAEFAPVPLEATGELWAQIFCSRESWVPIYDDIHEGTYGNTGLGNGSNPYGHSFHPLVRWVGWGKHQYELPRKLAEPFLLNDEELQDTDDFLGLVGSAMIDVEVDVLDVEGEPTGEKAIEKWIRCVYYKSTVLIDGRNDQETYGGETVNAFPYDSDYLRIYVVRFPVRIAETSEIPWRPDAVNDGTYEIEYEFEWLMEDDWITNPPAKVWFNKDGSKFTFTLYKMGESYTDALKYVATNWSEYTYTELEADPPEDVTRESHVIPLQYPRRSINPHHFEWTDSLIGTVGAMTVYTPEPLRADVECWYGDPRDAQPYTSDSPGNKSCYYMRRLVGEIDMFPHYNKADELKYVKLYIDEKSHQYGSRKSTLDGGGADFPDKFSYCWRHRKMVFPSGKEFVYMQQYMNEYVTTEFTPPKMEDTDFPNNVAWPGTGDENFMCFIHYMDLLEEDLVFSKFHTNKYLYYPIPGDTRTRFIINGDIEYRIDLSYGADRVEELLYTIPQDDSNTSMQTNLKTDLEEIMDYKLPTTAWVYFMDTTPCTFFRTQDLGGGLWLLNTAGTQVPDMYDVSGNFFLNDDEALRGHWWRPSYRGNPGTYLDVPWGAPPAAEHEVSCMTGSNYTGDSTLHAFGSAKLPYSFMVCNIAPNFGKWGEVSAKVLRYEGRIVVRVGVQHVHKLGYLSDGIVPAGENGWDNWGYHEPPDDGKVLLWANFDLEDATGVVGLRDIWPMGKII